MPDRIKLKFLLAVTIVVSACSSRLLVEETGEPFTGYKLEYLNSSLAPVDSSKSVYSHYIYYLGGVHLEDPFYPPSYRKRYLTIVDSTIGNEKILHGRVVTMDLKTNKPEETRIYENGYIQSITWHDWFKDYEDTIAFTNYKDTYENIEHSMYHYERYGNVEYRGYYVPRVKRSRGGWYYEQISRRYIETKEK